MATKANAARHKILAALMKAGRNHSNAAVLYHASVGALLGLSAVEEKTLDILEREGAVGPARLAELTGLTRPSVTGLLDRLEQKGFVRRIRDAVDKRRFTVTIDPAAGAKFEPVFAPFQQAMEDLYATYGDDELALILDFLERSERVQREAIRELPDSL